MLSGRAIKRRMSLVYSPHARTLRACGDYTRKHRVGEQGGDALEQEEGGDFGN